MKQIKHWQDPVNALLGVVLAISPWALGFDGATVAAANAVVIGVALVAAAMGAILFPRAWEEWTEAALGLWLIASPWVLGFAANADAMRAAVAAGTVIAALALWTLATDNDLSAWLHRLKAH